MNPRVQPRGNPLLGLVVITIMLVVGLSMLFFGAIPGYAKAGRLVSEGKPAVARITAVYDHTKGKGRYAEYSFAVNGVSYNGQADYQGGYGDRGPINIMYLPDDPSFSAINAEGKLSNAKGGVVFMIVWDLLASGFWVAMWFQWRKLRASF